jgi:hypothetical protein
MRGNLKKPMLADFEIQLRKPAPGWLRAALYLVIFLYATINVYLLLFYE